MGSGLSGAATMLRAANDAAASLTLREGLEAMGGDPPSSIPFLVRLLENPASPVALPGKIDLFGHDCLHLLLNRGFSLNDEAFVVGFTMGNDIKTNLFHLMIFQVFAFLLYPKAYRFDRAHLKTFAAGVAYGRSVRIKNLNQVNFINYQEHEISTLRALFGVQ